jgi:hypothetical protein
MEPQEGADQVDDTVTTGQVRGSTVDDGSGVADDDGPMRVGYRFPPRNPHTGAAVGLLRSQFPTSETR